MGRKSILLTVLLLATGIAMVSLARDQAGVTGAVLSSSDESALNRLATSISRDVASGDIAKVASILPRELGWEKLLVIRKQADVRNVRLRRQWRARIEAIRADLRRPRSLRLTGASWGEVLMLPAKANGFKEEMLAVEGLRLIGTLPSGLEIRIKGGTAVKTGSGWKLVLLD